MGDEQPAAAAEPATAAAEPVAKARRRRNPHANRAAPAAAEIGGDDGGRDPKGTEAAPVEAGTEHGAGYGAGPPSPSRTSETAPASSAESGQAEGRLSLDDLEFHALRGIWYHEARGAFLDLMRRCLDFGVVALGTTAVASLFAEKSPGTLALNVATALIGAIQLVANLGDKAQEHRWARRKFCDLLARVTEAKLEAEVQARELRKLTKRWTDIWGDEPTTMHVLEAIAHNATARSLQRDIDADDLIAVPWWRSLFRNWLAQEGFTHLTPREKREAKAKRAEAAKPT